MSKLVTGIDRRGEKLHTARIQLQSGRPMVEKVEVVEIVDRLENAEENAEPLIQSAGERAAMITWGVPDSLAIIKSLSVPEAGPASPCEIGRFEFLQSMLEAEEKFVTKVLPTKVMRRVLGIAWRKQVLTSVGLMDGSDIEQSYCSRGIALGRGFLEFCRVGQGDLITVVDISPENASICLLFRRQAADLACLKTNPETFSSPERVDRFALDLKTVINDKLASLQSDGISVPLSALVISGHGVDEQARQRLTEFFPVGVLAPDIHRGYFSPAVIDSTPFLSDYLVALGLALN